MVQFLADGIFYLIIISVVVSFFTASNDVDSIAREQEQQEENDTWAASPENKVGAFYKDK